MKILQLIPELAGGGAERLVVDLSNEFAVKHEVTLLTVYNSRTEDLYKNQITPKVTRGSLEKRLGFDRKVIPRLYKVIKK